MPHRKTSILSNASSTATSDKVKFPLQDDEIPRVTLTPEQVKQYRDSAYEVIRITLEAEIQFRYRDMAMMNPHDWKFLKSMERMKVYKRITPGGDLPSMVIGVGFIDGTMEDAFYGLHHKTTEEMRKTTTYVNKDMLDSAVIANLEMGTDADPFRYLGLKWRVAKTPMGNIIKNRDVCNMECMGIDTDEQGIKYGYLLLKSVDVPSFPVYPESMVVRAQMMLCCIYRQITPNVLAFYSKGVFNLCGDLADFMAFNTSADMVLSISQTVQCAAAKRLTLMYLRLHGRETGGEKSQRTIRSDLSSRDSTDSMHVPELKPSGSHCSLCQRKPSLLSARCKRCRLCGEAVCSKCYLKPHLMARPRNFRVVCCKSCMVKSREFPVDPRDPYPIINGSCWQPQSLSSESTKATSSTDKECY
ncbi:hypothetical protein FI667_g8820, partial [Globisporangium splendens]